MKKNKYKSEPKNKKLFFTKSDMKKAFNRGARNGSVAGMRVARGGELYMEHFDEWFSKNY
jgi:hypothetical protein